MEVLYEYVKIHDVKHLVLAFRDSEAFDLGLLSDLLSLIRYAIPLQWISLPANTFASSWNDRLPFTLIFGISTSTELFEGRLPRSTAGLLQGKKFKIHDVGDAINRIYDSIQMGDGSRLWLGHQISASLFDRSRDYFHSPEGFSRKVKVRIESGNTIKT